MTKEEAIKILDNTLFYAKDNKSRNDIDKALDMAIISLGTSPRFLVREDGSVEQIIEPCEDVARFAERVATTVAEETDRFIFETIKPYCERIEKREISKKDLECALVQYFHKEPCEDCISRADAINGLDWVNGDYETVNKEYDRLIALPSVTPTRSKGEWEHHFIRPNIYADLFWYCSNCNGRCGYANANHYNFCPNCGADMRGDKV